MNKQVISDLIDALGADALTERLNVTPYSLRHARATKAFPASWYGPMLDMCKDAGIECPLEAFNWKGSELAPAERGAA